MKLMPLIIVLVVMHCSATAQLSPMIGLKAGAVTASQSWNYAAGIPDLNTTNRWGLDVGLFVEWLNIPVLTISGEIHYIQKGMTLKVPVTTEQSPDGTGEFVTMSPRADYFSIPVLGKVRFLEGQVTPYVLAGPRVDFLLQTKGDEFDVVFRDFKNTEFGATLGIGFELSEPQFPRMGIEFRYSPTFTDGYSSPLLKVRNSSMEVLLVAGLSH